MAEIPTIQRPLVVGERLLIRAAGRECAHLETIDEVGPRWFRCRSGVSARIRGSVICEVDADGQPSAVVEPPVAEPPPPSANPARPLPEPAAPLPGRPGRGRALPPGRAEFYLAVKAAVDSGDYETMVDAHAAVLATWTQSGHTHLKNTRKFFTTHKWKSGIMTRGEATRRRWERDRAARQAAADAVSGEPPQPPCSLPAEPVQPPCKPAAEPAAKPRRKGGSRKWDAYWPLLVGELADGDHASLADAMRAAEARFGRPGPAYNQGHQYCRLRRIAYPKTSGAERFRRAGLVPGHAIPPRRELFNRAAIDAAAPGLLEPAPPAESAAQGAMPVADLPEVREADLDMLIEGIETLVEDLRTGRQALRLARRIYAVMCEEVA